MIGSRFKTNIYNVYYRQKQATLLFGKNKLSGFIKIKNPFGRWAADPFVISLGDRDLVFAEMAGISSRKGDIYCLDLRAKKKKWIKCIRSSFHMSFPNVFGIGNDYFMVPETAHDNTVSLYRAISMPSLWAKERVLFTDSFNFHPVDNVYIPSPRGPFTDSFLSYIKKDQQNCLALFKKTEGVFHPSVVLSDCNHQLRPAGQIFSYNDELFYPSQDCETSYGHGLIINAFKMSPDGGSFEVRKLFEIQPVDIIESGLSRNCVGVHTYNFNERFEVIDVITCRFSVLALFGKAARVIGRLFRKKIN